jgi:WD40 repeat protein
MEVFTASKDHLTPSFKELNPLSEPSHLSNIVNSLVFGQRQRLYQRTRQHRSFSGLKQHFHLYSSHHALPELISSKKREDESFFSNIDPHWLQNKDQIAETTFKNYHDELMLWQYLTSDKTLIPSTNNHEQGKEASQSSSIGKGISDEQVCFSNEIEIVKCRDIIRSFCVDRSNPNNLAFASSKIIREINIDHSIRYRKRNATLDKLMDEEANTWEASLHRFDSQSMHDKSNMNLLPNSSNIAHIPSNSSFNLFDFIHPSNLVENNELNNIASGNGKSSKTNKFVGIGNEGFQHDNNALNKLKKRLNISRRPSFTTNSPSASHFKSPSRMSKRKLGTNGIDHNQNVTALLTHPFLPFYLSGGVDGAIYMWQYGLIAAIRTYREAQNTAVTSLHFSRFGYKFGATDAAGTLTLWRFEASKDSLRPFDVLKCHSGRATDFTFLDSGSMVATVGTSSQGERSLKVWDLLMPHHESCIYSYVMTNDDPVSIIYSTKYKSIIVGTKRGDIYVFDVRTRSVVHVFNIGTNASVDALCLDVTEEFFVTGSSEGDVQVWDMKTLSETHRFSHAHAKHKFFNLEFSSNQTMSTLGVTHIDLSTSFMYTSGSDGRIIRRAIM